MMDAEILRSAALEAFIALAAANARLRNIHGEECAMRTHALEELRAALGARGTSEPDQ